MVELLKPSSNGDAATAPAAKKICPLGWQLVAQQAPAGLALPNGGLTVISPDCAGARCGWWSTAGERCSMAVLGDLPRELDTVTDALNAIHDRLPPTAADLEDAGLGAPARTTHDISAGLQRQVEAMVSTSRDQGDRALDVRARIADELRRLRHVLVGVYDAARVALGAAAPQADELERIGRGMSQDQRSEDGGGKASGEPG